MQTNSSMSSKVILAILFFKYLDAEKHNAIVTVSAGSDAYNLFFSADATSVSVSNVFVF